MPFKFEMWFLEPDFYDVANHAWNCVEFLGNLSRRFALKLKALKCQLKTWNRNLGLSLKSVMKACKGRIRGLDLLEEFKSLSAMERFEREMWKKEFLKVALSEEILWKQRSQVNWLKKGDRNTKFFHKMAFHRKISNVIYGLSINGR